MERMIWKEAKEKGGIGHDDSGESVEGRGEGKKEERTHLSNLPLVLRPSEPFPPAQKRLK